MVKRLLMVTLAVCAVSAVTIAARAQDGRWKLDGNGGCYFDATDSGPDQCVASTTGRWKDDGNGGCVFDASDSGPNQCTPPQQPSEAPTASASEVAAPETPVSGAAESRAGTEQDRHVAPER